MPVALARRVLGLLNCTVGATAKKHSKIRKGEVISTTPAAGNQPAGTAVSLIVSSGPAHKKHR
jgi:beta-lactam-binding protein with PASTA domain